MQVLCRFIVVFLLMYSAKVFCEKQPKPEEYIVTINDIPMYEDCAKNIFLNITDNGKNAIEVYDNLQKKYIPLSKVEKNMDITIRNNAFISKIAKLYDHIVNTENADTTTTSTCNTKKCLHVNEGNNLIDLCIETKTKAKAISWLFYFFSASQSCPKINVN